MGLVRADLAERGGRSVVISHCFAAGVEPTPHLERDIQQGGIDVVPLSVFDGSDYVALGHIHGRQQLSERVRYAGAPLHYSFGEARQAARLVARRAGCRRPRVGRVARPARSRAGS